MECAAKDLHSGVFGGTVNEAMVDLVWMMNQLVDEDGNILVEGLMDSVAPLTKAEEEKYVNIDFDVEEYRGDIGTPGRLMHGTDKIKTLMSRWRYPSLSLHGIQGAFSDPGAKTVIPRKVSCSCRSVTESDGPRPAGHREVFRANCSQPDSGDCGEGCGGSLQQSLVWEEKSQ